MQIGNTQPAAYNPSDFVAGPPVLSTDPAKLVAAPSLEDLNAPPEEPLLAEKVAQAHEAMKAGDEGVPFKIYEGDHQVVEGPQQVSGLNVNITT